MLVICLALGVLTTQRTAMVSILSSKTVSIYWEWKSRDWKQSTIKVFIQITALLNYYITSLLKCLFTWLFIA